MLVEVSDEHGPPPRFSVISACFNVARFVDDFAASLERQPVAADDIEVIVVDDGSTDDSVQQLERCARASRFRWRLLTQENAGQGAARNRGIDEAIGEWSTFVDPDDWLDDRYFAVIGAFLDEFPEVELAAGARVPMYEEEGGWRRGSHPLDAMFVSDVVVDLDRFPDYFHGSAPAAFLRTDRLRAEQLRFDPAIRPNFEDAHFIARYLLACATPTVGFVGSARYYYRRRSDGSSSTQGAFAEVSRFTMVPRHGILDVLERAEQQRGLVPFWLQNLAIYELSYYFSESEERQGSIEYACQGAVADEFLAVLRQIASKLSADMVRGFRVRRFDPAWRDIVLHSVHGETWNTPYAVVRPRTDAETTVAVRYSGEPPEIVVLSGGVAVAESAVHNSIELFGRPLLFEQIVTVSGPQEIRVVHDRTHLPLVDGWAPQVANTYAPAVGGPRYLPARLSRGRSHLPSAESLRADRRRRFRLDFMWRAKRKARHLATAIRRH